MSRPNLGPKLALNRSGNYEVRWSENGRSKSFSLRTSNLSEAKVGFANWMLRYHRSPREVGPTVYTVEIAKALRWEEHVIPRVVDQTRLEFCWARLMPVFGDLPVSAISPKTVSEYGRARRAEGAGDATIRKELSELGTALNHLVKTRRLKPDEISAISLPQKSPPRDRILSAQEIHELLATAAGRRKNKRLSRIERYVWILLQTGCRPTPPLELTWDRVDFERKLIDFNVPGRKRTKKKRPIVRISERLCHFLEAARREREGKYVLDHPGAIKKSFSRLVIDAGLKDVTPYTLRHTWASHALMNGADIWKVAKMLGNSVQMVDEVYGHLIPEYLDDTVNWHAPPTAESPTSAGRASDC